jgi:cytochrome c biogenesis protein ResB
MKRVLIRLASNKLTLVGFALLAMGILSTHNRPDAPAAAISLPLALLALNLAASMVLRPALRRGGLAVFHAALLALMLLAGIGRLTHFDGRVEVAEGAQLDPLQIEITQQGAWHGSAWRQLAFRQGPFEVHYAAGMKRAHTRSQVWVSNNTSAQTVGDDTPLVQHGYRFYTTHNKGYAPLLSWQPEGGTAVQGLLHLPSYPMFDWKQENQWTAPDGTQLRFWLRIERPLAERSAWTLDPHSTPALLIVEAQRVRHELRPGQTATLRGARLRYERLAGWMGYRIFYDPTLLPMLITALLGVAGLAWHLWQRSARALRLPEGVMA